MPNNSLRPVGDSVAVLVAVSLLAQLTPCKLAWQMWSRRGPAGGGLVDRLPVSGAFIESLVRLHVCANQPLRNRAEQLETPQPCHRAGPPGEHLPSRSAMRPAALATPRRAGVVAGARAPDAAPPAARMRSGMAVTRRMSTPCRDCHSHALPHYAPRARRRAQNTIAARQSRARKKQFRDGRVAAQKALWCAAPLSDAFFSSSLCPFVNPTCPAGARSGRSGCNLRRKRPKLRSPES